jgi:hypothetical protein
MARNAMSISELMAVIQAKEGAIIRAEAREARIRGFIRAEKESKTKGELSLCDLFVINVPTI